MAATHTVALLEQVQRLSGDPADAVLLSRFVVGRDEAAFAALLRQHGPMVLGIGRRVLKSESDAEDVLQATFLLLARQAASIRKRESVGCWLHGVAHRLARKVQTQNARRRARERRAAEMHPRQTPAAVAWGELQALLDEALRGLPEKYRAPLVLCCLEGKSQAEAAAQLRCPPGTVCSRLVRGRKLLHARLARRGLTLSAAALVIALEAGAAPAALPVRLIIALSGKRAGLPPTVAALVEQGLRSTVALRSVAALVVLLAACVAAGAAVLHRPAEDKRTDGTPPAAASPLPAKQKQRSDRFGDGCGRSIPAVFRRKRPFSGAEVE